MFFRAYSEQFQTAFESQYYMHLEQLKFVKHFFETDEHVTEAEFVQFTQTLFTSGYLQSLQWGTCAIKREENCKLSVKFQKYVADEILITKPDTLDQKLFTSFVNQNSKIIFLVKKSNKLAETAYIVAFVPVYKAQKLVGVLKASYALESMIDHHLKTIAKNDVLIQVRENNHRGPLLFQSETSQSLTNLFTLSHSFLVKPQLHFLLLPNNDFIHKEYSIIVWWTSVAIMLVMSFLTIILLMLSGYTEVIKREVKERTEALRISYLKLTQSEAQRL